jgi:hypothetical protein
VTIYLLIITLIGYTLVGRLNFIRVGLSLKKALGFSGSGKNEDDEGEDTEKEKAAIAELINSIPPTPKVLSSKYKNGGIDPNRSWLIGAAVARLWNPDPGFFYILNKARHLVMAPYYLSAKILQTNLLIIAPPGAGKTRSIFRPLIDYARYIGAAAIFFDPKGDDFPAELFDYNFDPMNPQRSIKLNVFVGDTPEQAGERLGEALIPNLADDKKYFSDVAKDAMAALVSSYHAVYKRYPELATLVLYLNDPSELKDLYNALKEKEAAAAEKANLLEAAIAKQNQNPANFQKTGKPDQVDDSRVTPITLTTEANSRLENLRAEVEALYAEKAEYKRLAGNLSRSSTLANGKYDALGNLITALTPLTAPNISSMLVCNPNSQGDSYTIEQLLKQPGLIRLALPVAKYPRIAPIIGRLILAQFNYAVLDPNCNRDILKLAAVDEARHFITASVASGMAQGRSNGAGYLLALQALSQIEQKSLLDTIFAASGTKIVLPGVGDEDAERFSKIFGDIELPYVTHSVNSNSSVNTGTNRGNSSSSKRGNSALFGGGENSIPTISTNRGSSSGKSSGSGNTTNYQTKQRRLYITSEVRQLSTRYAIIESSDAEGQRWFAQIINMDAGVVQQLKEKMSEELEKINKRLRAKKKNLKVRIGQKSNVEQPQEKQVTQAAGKPTTFGNSSKVAEVEKVRYKPVTVAQPIESEVVTKNSVTQQGFGKNGNKNGAEVTNTSVGNSVNSNSYQGPTTNTNNENVTNSGNNEGVIQKVQEETKQADANIQTQLEEIERLLADPDEGDVRPEQLPLLMQIITSQMMRSESKRTIEDVRRVITQSKGQQFAKYRGSYITRLIRADDYPTAKPSLPNTLNEDISY